LRCTTRINLKGSSITHRSSPASLHRYNRSCSDLRSFNLSRIIKNSDSPHGIYRKM